MSFQSCLDEIQRAAGREFSDEELERLFEELQNRARTRRARDQLGDDAFIESAAEIGAEQQQAAIITKRNEALNRVRRAELLDFIRTGFADDLGLGAEAALVGVNRSVKGARHSASAQAKGMVGKYLGGLTADLEAEGLMPHLLHGHLDRRIAQELWELDRPDGRPGISESREAAAIAKIIRKYQEVARLDANAAGAWIRKLPGYIVRQSHDVSRIRSAGFQEWRSFIVERLDERTFEGVADREQFLENVWEGLASGVHLRARGGAAEPGFKGPRNIAEGLSQDRLLHFRSADDWFDYHERFGRGNLNEAVLFGLERMGRTTGLMLAMGPNPESNMAQVFEALISRADVDERSALERKQKQLVRALNEVDGTVNMQGGDFFPESNAFVRAVQDMSKLGAATLSATADIPIAASELRFQGDSMLSGMAKTVTGLVQGFTNGREQREIASMLGVFYDGAVQNIAARFDPSDGVPGIANKMRVLFFKLNGLTWWTDTIRGGVTRAMGHRLALNKGRAFEALDPDLQRVLGLFDIGENEWNVLRQAAREAADGNEYVIPSAVAELPDEAFSSLLGGQKPTRARLRRTKTDLENKLRSYYNDRARTAVIEADERTQVISPFGRQGLQRGTVEGELMRHIGQFKSFPTAVIQKVLGREVFGRGDQTGSLRRALLNGNGEAQGLAQIILWTTLFGYGAMAAKDLAKGRTPRDPNDVKTWMAAMVQGGGAGIYGDFLFGQVKNRFGGGFLETLAGPTLGQFNTVADLYGRFRDGDDAAAQLFRFVQSNTPFINLFYTRAALDYLILYQIQEALSPGYLRRLERRVREENEQEFLIPPSQAA